MAVLLLPEVLKIRELNPTETLLVPVLFLFKAYVPIATLPLPSIVVGIVPYPRIVL
jgi:hypothetical protein